MPWVGGQRTVELVLSFHLWGSEEPTPFTRLAEQSPLPAEPSLLDIKYVSSSSLVSIRAPR